MLKRKRKKPLEMPELSQLKAELKRERYQRRYGSVLRSTIYSLVVVAACAILVAVLWMPVLRIYGNSMTPTVSAGEIVVSWKGSSFAQGDLIAMYYANKLLVKRVIAGPGEWVDIDEDGNVFVNEKPLDEPYLVEKALGDCDIELPFQVPEDRYFVMGDHRSTSADFRLASIGPIPAEDVVGRIIFRVWPVERFGPLK
ncbi:MAG: signal peptidase I [Oscillibacter sp.]|nr:signal peptidase I [Oscillibacter sp.]